MSNEFLKSSGPKFDAQVSSATRVEDIVQLCHNDAYTRILPDATIAAPSAREPEQEEGTVLLRRAVTIGDTTRLLEAYSHTGLDVLEAAFRRQQG
jgi:hypothetical protein